jgi:hypothetical protein
MTTALRRVALTDYAARWALIAAVGIVSACGMRALGVAIVWPSLLPMVVSAAALMGSIGVYSLVAPRMPRLTIPVAVISDVALSLLQIMAVTTLFLPLTYLAAASGFPLIDADLARLDARLFGFEWNAAARWVADRPKLDSLLTVAYFSIPLQLGVIILIGSVNKPGERNGELIWHFCIALLITTFVSAFAPALGKVGHVGVEYLGVITEIRGGLWTVMDFTQAEGIITFPSFHVALAILFSYAARHHRWALAVFVPLNVLMIAGTPTVGGHYLIDLQAGAAVAVVAIAVTRRLRARLVSARRTVTGSSTAPAAEQGAVLG